MAKVDKRPSYEAVTNCDLLQRIEDVTVFVTSFPVIFIYGRRV